MASDSASRFVVRDCFGGGNSLGHGEQTDHFNTPVDLVSQTYSFARNDQQIRHEMGHEFGRRICPEIYPSFEPQRVNNRNGSEVRFDEFDRVTGMRDAANRNFEFKYDRKTGELNQVKNEYGTWHRQKHSDEWKSDDGAKWRGEIEVNARGYSYTNYDASVGRGDRTVYRPDGSKAVEWLGANREVLSRHREDRNGNSANEDFASGKANYTMSNGRRANRDLNNGSVVVYDADGNLTAMRDAGGKSFKFSDFDDRGRPQSVTDERGSWTRHGQDYWVNKETGKGWYGQVEIDKEGVYSYSDSGSGRKVSHNRTGETVVRDRGIVTTVDKDGSKIDNFIDGEAVQDGAKAAIQFKVVKGETTVGVLNFSTKGEASKVNVEVVRDKDDIHALVHSKPDSAVRAMQEGQVVYSFNHKDSNHRAGSATDRLGSQDLAMLDRYRKNNPDQDIVVMACYDKQAKGLRYQIYGGLDLASTNVGDTIKAGDVIGRSGEQGYTYAAKRQRLTGKAVDLKVLGAK